jgi:hypothetical protein
MESYIIIIIYCVLASYIFIVHGDFFYRKILKYALTNISNYELGLLGVFAISIYALILNFFLKLDNILNLIIIFFPLTIFFKITKKRIKHSFILGIISFLTLILTHSNRPDGGLYHLPFINILNDYKLSFGLSNLHFRFGHTSILQYLSAIFNNVIFTDNGILIPLATIFSLIICHFYSEFKKSKNQFYKILLFFLLFTIIYSMNNYAKYGNDKPAHMFFFLAILYFFKEQTNKYNNSLDPKIVLFSIYTFLIKPTFIFIFFLPIYFFIKNPKIIINNKRLLIIGFLVMFLWILKNIFISSCAVYPIQITCFKNLEWSSFQSKQGNPIDVSESNEAWAKDYPNRKDQSISEKEYISNFKWINVWSHNHIKTVLWGILPLVTVVIFFALSNIMKGFILDNNTKKKIIYLFAICTISSIYWFFKFPTFRYGAPYIYTLIICAYFLTLFFKKRRGLYNIQNKTIMIFILLGLFTIFLKDLGRIYFNFNLKYTDYPWPKKNSFTEENKKNTNIPIYNNKNELLYYKPYPYSLCMYSKSPCTSENPGEIIVKKTILNNLIYISK